jgi:hypothetical protein
MENEQNNPYKTPEAAVGVERGGQLSDVFDRFSAWGVLGLSFITLGIYGIYWMYSRTQRINPHTSEPIGSAFVTTTVALYVLGAMGNLAEVLDMSDTVIVVLSLASLISGIMGVIWIFKIRNRIHDYIGAVKGEKTWFGPVLTFFFSVIYVQYKINCVIDEERD